MSVVGKALRRLTKFRINEISLVDEGDNPGAEVSIFKRREPTLDTDVIKTRFEEAATAAGELIDLAGGAGGTAGVEQATEILKGMDMDIEQLGERLGEIEANLDTVTKAKDAAEARVAELEAANAALVEKAKEAPVAAPVAAAVAEPTDEDVLKSLPEPIRKRLLDAEAAAAAANVAIEKARDENELTAAIAKAKEMGIADHEEVGALLHRIAKGKACPKDAAKVEEMLKAASAVKEGEENLFKAIGKANGGDANDANAKVDQAVADIQKAKPGITREAAYSEVMDANPDLYAALTGRA